MIEKTLERMTLALERIALTLEIKNAPAMEGIEKDIEVEKEIAEVEVPKTEEVQPELDRVAIRKQLDDLKVEYNTRSNTKNLSILLEKSLASLPGKEVSPAKVEEKKEVVTEAQAREALKQFSLKFGIDKAKAILAEFKSAKVSEVPAEKLPAFVARIGHGIKQQEGMFN